MSLVKITPQVGGVPETGVDGHILMKDSTVPEGYRWSNSIAFASDRISNTDIEARLIVGDSEGTRLGITVAGDEVFKVFSNRIESSVTINGRTLEDDGTKLDGIQPQAQRNPQQVSVVEKNTPTQFTNLRSFTPKDIADIAVLVATADFVHHPVMAPDDFSEAPDVTGLRSMSPSNIVTLIEAYAAGEVNPNRVSSQEIENSNASASVRSFSPSDIYAIHRNITYQRNSTSRVVFEESGEYVWDHGEKFPPTLVETYLTCQIAEHGYEAGDNVFVQMRLVTTQNGSEVFLLQSEALRVARRGDPRFQDPVTPSNWRLRIRGIWTV